MHIQQQQVRFLLSSDIGHVHGIPFNCNSAYYLEKLNLLEGDKLAHQKIRTVTKRKKESTIYRQKII